MKKYASPDKQLKIINPSALGYRQDNQIRLLPAPNFMVTPQPIVPSTFTPYSLSNISKLDSIRGTLDGHRGKIGAAMMLGSLT